MTPKAGCLVYLRDEGADAIRRDAAGRGNSSDLKLSIGRANVRIEATAGGRYGVGRDLSCSRLASVGDVTPNPFQKLPRKRSEVRSGRG